MPRAFCMATAPYRKLFRGLPKALSVAAFAFNTPVAHSADMTCFPLPQLLFWASVPDAQARVRSLVCVLGPHPQLSFNPLFGLWSQHLLEDRDVLCA